MHRRLVLLAILLALLLAPAAVADDANPSIAIIRFGPVSDNSITEGAVLDILESYGYISTAENRLLESRQNLEGDNISIMWGDAGFDVPTLNLIIESALDAEVDLIVAGGALVSLVAIAATSEMETPTPVLFNNVTAPFGSGFADSECIKADHVTGSRVAVSYEYVFDALLLQDPDISSVGTIFNTSEVVGTFGSDEVTRLGEAMGITVESAGVLALSDFRPAVNALVENGVEAIVLPFDPLVSQGLPIIAGIANEVGLPLFHPSFATVGKGVTIGAGASPLYDQGTNVGRMLVAHLNGELDIARTGIATSGELLIGVNLDSASEQGIEISEAILDEAVAVIKDGRPARLHPDVLAAIARRGVIVPAEQRLEDDMAWLAALQCTDEMIAEQQAALDAGE